MKEKFKVWYENNSETISHVLFFIGVGLFGFAFGRVSASRDFIEMMESSSKLEEAYQTGRRDERNTIGEKLYNGEKIVWNNFKTKEKMTIAKVD